jgi:hypothetical protein
MFAHSRLGVLYFWPSFRPSSWPSCPRFGLRPASGSPLCPLGAHRLDSLDCSNFTSPTHLSHTGPRTNSLVTYLACHNTIRNSMPPSDRPTPTSVRHVRPVPTLYTSLSSPLPPPPPPPPSSRTGALYTCHKSYDGMKCHLDQSLCFYNLNFSTPLLIRSTAAVLSSGLYWFVTSLMTSCAAIPPKKAAVVGGVRKPPRTLIPSDRKLVEPLTLRR